MQDNGRPAGAQTGGGFAGGCQCGAVRYRSSANTAFSIQCYCRQCQRMTGSGYAPQVGLPRDSVTFVGQLQRFEVVADSGQPVELLFCGTCGTPIGKRPRRFPDRIFLLAGSLDDPSLYQPGNAVWRQSSQNWDMLAEPY